MKNYTFTFNNTNLNDKNYTFQTGFNKNYSKDLDDIIATDIKKKNYFLFNNIISSPKKTLTDYIIYKTPATALKSTPDFSTAAAYIYTLGNQKAFPYKYNKTYELADGTPIIFFEDAIQIGFDLFYYDDFKSTSFLSALAETTKKTIMTIYIDGIEITIKK